MIKNIRLSTLLLSSLILSTSLTSPAYALDAQVYLKQLEEQAKAKDGTFNYKSVDKNSDGTTTIKGFAYVVKDTIVNAEEISFENAERLGTKGFKFEGMEGKKINFVGKDKDGKNIVLVIENIEASDFSLPDSPDRKIPLWPLDMGDAKIRNMSIVSDNDGENLVVNIPEVQLSDLSHKGENSFTLGGFKTSEVNSFIKSKDVDMQMVFGGVELNGLEYFGTFGIQLDRFSLGNLTLNGTNKPGDKIDLDFAGLDMKNLYLPDAQDENRPFLPEKDLSMELGKLQFNINDADVMGWEKGYGANATNSETGVVEGSGTFNGIYIDFGKIPLKPENKQNLQALYDLGYEKITMDIAGTGKWDTKTGILEMSEYKVAIKDMGTLDLAATISGYTPELAREINQISNQANFESDPQKLQALNLQMLAKMTALSFNKLQVKIIDDSLLNKVVGLQAKKLKQEPEQITGIVGPMASIMLAPYNVPQFAASLGQALTTFMQGNKSITVLADPANPIAVTEIIALSSGAQAGTVQPAELIERFNLTVTAE